MRIVNDWMDRMKKTTIASSFASLVESYISKNDSDNIMSIFPALANYNTDELFIAFFDKSNYKYYDEAKSVIYEHAILVNRTSNIFLYASEVENYIHKVLDYYVFGDSVHLIKHKRGVYYLLKLSVFLGYRRLIKPKEQKYVSSFDDVIKDKRNNTYYRGQIDSNWRISPSVLRDLNKSVVFDDNYYFRLLNKTKLEDKYNDLIRTSHYYEKYSKYAFMQHALSFSPLIDFTKEKEIATSFALSNPSQINVLENHESAVFDIKVDSNNRIEDKIDAYDFLKKDFKIDVINSDTFVLGKKYKLKGFDDSGKEYEKIICISSIDDLLERFRPKYKLFDIPVNDRMKYQKGVFICFYDCIALKTRICYELNSDIDLYKSLIKTADKKDILKGIYKNRKYDQEHLLDPYLFFTEYFFWLILQK